MKKLFNSHKSEQISIILTLISLTLIKIFPIYLGSSGSKLFSTHVASKLLIIVLFFYNIIRQVFFSTKSPQKVEKIFIIPLLIYLCTATASILAAVDIELYLRQLQNVVINCMLFYIGFSLFSYKNWQATLLRYLVGVGLFCFVFDVVFLILGTDFIKQIKDVIQIEILALFTHNANMGRYNSYLVLDSFIPIFFLVFSHSYKKKSSALIFIIMITTTVFISYSTLFRTRLIQGLFALFASFFVFFKEKWRSIVFPFFIVPIIFFGLYFTTKIVSPSSMTVVERFLLTNRGEDVDTIQYRYISLQRAFDMLHISPFVGIGLGNYKSYMNRLPGYNIPDKLTKIHYEETLNNPHSMFIEVLGETGIFGLIGFVGLLCYFIYIDLQLILRDQQKYISSIIILTWTIFLYGIFNPFNTVYIAGWFWFMRGYIQANKHSYV
jgi:hypothetical protein